MELRIKELRLAQGMTQEDLAAAAGISASYVSQIERGANNKNFRSDKLPSIARALGVRTSELIADDVPIPVVGEVGAGTEVMLVDAYEKGGGTLHVACPREIGPYGIAAVRVIGESAVPTYNEKDILFFSQRFRIVEPEDIGRNVICEDDAGFVWVKRLRVGREPGTYDLYSLNPAHPNIYGVRLRWATRVLMAISCDLVKVLNASDAIPVMSDASSPS